MSVTAQLTSAASFGEAQGPAPVVLEVLGGARLEVPADARLMGAEFGRVGHDLIIEGAGEQTIVVREYFASDAPPALITEDGLLLRAETVARLAGPLAPGQVAQTSGAEAAAIGKVTSFEGGAVATHVDGTSTTLATDSPIFQGDVIETGAGAAINVVFVDNTSFSLGANARMVIDELVYDPSSGQGQAAFSLVQGLFVFVSGDIADAGPDAMTLSTPVATIGIRGTGLGIQAAAEGLRNLISLLVDPTGKLGSALVSNDGGSALLDDVNEATSVTSFLQAPSNTFILSAQQLLALFQGPLDLSPFGGALQDVGGDTLGDEGTEGEGERSDGGGATNVTNAGGEDDPFAGFDVAFLSGLLAFNPLLEALNKLYVPNVGGGIPIIGTEFDAPDDELIEFVEAPGGGGGRRGLGTDGDDILDASLQGTQNESNVLAGLGGNDTIIGGNLDDVLLGNAGNDLLIGGSGLGNDLIDGGADTDTVSFASATLPVFVNLLFDQAFGSFGVFDGIFQRETGIDILSNIENVIGGANGDSITGDDNDNVLEGGGGNDILIGNGGNDSLGGGAGNDTISYQGNGVGIDADLGAGTVLGASTDTVISIENVIGSTLADIIVGDGADNILQGIGGDDLIRGGDGDDSLLGGFGNDNLQGQGGNDVLNGGGVGDDVLDGGTGNDTADFSGYFDPVDVNLGGGVQGIGDDSVVLNGIENLSGSGFNDTLTGDAGDNRLFGNFGNDVLRPGAGGDDVLDGGFGQDTADFSQRAGPVAVDLGLGQATGSNISLISIENVIGTGAGDMIRGDDLFFVTNSLFGGGGGDSIDGLGGDDFIRGEGGNDSLQGGDGADFVRGDAGNDSVDGGNGDDTVQGDDGNDAVRGQAGNDLLRDGIGVDQLDGGADNDRLQIDADGDSGEVFDGGAGSDTLDLGAASAGIATSVDLSILVAQNFGGGFGTDTVLNIENIDGSVQVDNLTGNGGSNLLQGFDNDDVLDGAGGDDVLVGGSGNDDLQGGLGNDTLAGDLGNDVIDGGADTDTLSFVNSFVGPITVDLGNAGPQNTGEGNDTITNVENVIGSFDDDVLTGKDGVVNVLDGFFGDDIINGALDGDDDTYDGGFGFDEIRYFGDPQLVIVDLSMNTATGAAIGTDTLFGFESVLGTVNNDTITGDFGNNTLNGFDGADIVNGAAGFDELLGGAGNDQLNGGGDDDVLLGGADGDTLHGDDGNDILNGEGDFNDLFGDAGNDSLIGGTGNDALLDGGADFDTADYSGASPLLIIDLTQANNQVDRSGEFDDLVSIERIIAGNQNDQFTGDDNANVFEGRGGNDTATGGLGDDTLDGGAGSDTLDGGDDNDLLIAGAGSNITLMGGIGDDTLRPSVGMVAGNTLDGGAGFDFVDLSLLNDTFTADLDRASGSVDASGGPLFANLLNIEGYLGGAGIDEVTGDDGGVDSIFGNGGNDTLMGLGGNDFLDAGFDFGINTLDGDNGNDMLIGAFGTNTFIGGAGNDIYNGARGFNDIADFSASGAGVTVNLANAAAQNTGEGNDTFLFIEHVRGSAQKDVITGSAGNNTLIGDGGSDTLRGEGGIDELVGGNGADDLFGGAGDDSLDGGAGNDLLDGGSGFDTADYSANGTGIDADLGAGTVLGGSTDTVSGIERVIGTDFKDIMRGTGAADQFEGGLGNDSLFGEGGADFLSGGNGNNLLDGGAGNDFLFGGLNDDSLFGGAGNDQISTSLGTNLADGGAGDDILSGGNGVDILRGGEGDDVIADGNNVAGPASSLDGGDGNDVLSAGTGDQIFIGGAGNDTVNFVIFGVAVTVDLTIAGPQVVNGALGNDTFIDIENVGGSNAADVLTGNAADNILEGFFGNDVLNGGEGVDVASYSSTFSRVIVDLNDIMQSRTGGLGTDTLNSIEGVIGGFNNDILTGTIQGNILQGGFGRDILTGGGGNDFFRYVSLMDGGTVGTNTPAAATGTGVFGDFILDFDTGVDKLIFDAAAFGLPVGALDPANFAAIIDPYDGTNSGIAGNTPVFVFSDTDGTLYFDNDTATPGYSVIANVLAGNVAAGDIEVQQIA